MSHSIGNAEQYSNINVGTVNHPPSYQQTEIVNLNPLDVGFEDWLFGSSTLDGEQTGEYLDRYWSMSIDRSITFPLQVFHFEGKYYSKESQNQDNTITAKTFRKHKNYRTGDSKSYQ